MADIDPTTLMYSLIITNGLWLFMTWNVRKIIGSKHWDSALKVATRRIKNPARYHLLHKGTFYHAEFQDTTENPKFTPDYSVHTTLDEDKRYTGEGPYKEYFIPHGSLTNVDPAKGSNYSLLKVVERIGINSNKDRELERWRMRKNMEGELVTKKHFNIGIVIVLIAVVIVIALIYQMNTVVETFQTTYETYKPAIDQAIANLPRISPGG